MDLDLQLSSYDYDLPMDAIAQIPENPVHNAKLLIAQVKDGGYDYQEARFIDLIGKLDSQYVLFLNRTKVFKARIPLRGIRILKKTGEEVFLKEGEIFVYSILGEGRFEALVSDGKHFKPGTQIFLNDKVSFHSLAFTENGIEFQIFGTSLFEFLDQCGEMPLPPYIQYEKDKEQRYQTTFAEELGSAAAPTASLHFSPCLIRGLEERDVGLEYVCLHVGLGTFKPVWEEDIRNQKLHFEPMIVEKDLWSRIYHAKKEGKKFLPVGTTMVRYLESLPYLWAYLQKKQQVVLAIDSEVQEWRNTLVEKLDRSKIYEFIPEQELIQDDYGTIVVQTRLFLRPGIGFLLVDELISNFHLPKSSLLMLISAFMGRENALEAYQWAIAHDFKFYSFGDGMWIKK